MHILEQDNPLLKTNDEVRGHKITPTNIFWLKLVGVNAVVAGLEIAASVAFTFIPPLLLKIGYGETQMSIIFGIAPLLALLTVPSIGKYSDTCRSKWGRRRPFIFGLSGLLIAGLASLTIAHSLLFQASTKLVGMVVIAVNVIIIDYAFQAAINPCESLMADYLHSVDDPDSGYLIYSSMLSLGSCVGFFLAAINWDQIGHFLGTVEQTAFVVVLILFTLCLGLTMILAREVPFEGTIYDTDVLVPLISTNGDTLSDKGYGSGDEELGWSMVRFDGAKGVSEKVVTVTGEESALFCGEEFDSTRFCTSGGLALHTSPQWPLRWSSPRSTIGLITDWPLRVINMIRCAPNILQRIFWADLFSWMAVMAHVMFCTDFVATVVYQGRADAESGSLEARLFDEGVRMGSLGLLLHSLTALLFAILVQNSLTALIGIKNTYLFGLMTFSLAMLFTVLFPNVVVLNICAAISGIGFTVITTVPNTLITLYHSNAEVYFKARVDRGGYGQDIAILDMGYYLSQIILSLVMGQVVEMSGLPQLYILMSSICGFLATYFATRVVFSINDLAQSD